MRRRGEWGGGVVTTSYNMTGMIGMEDTPYHTSMTFRLHTYPPQL